MSRSRLARAGAVVEDHLLGWVVLAVVVAAGLPTVASLPAVAFGLVEMGTSAGLARMARR